MSHPRVIAWPSRAAALPALEGALCVRPRDERSVVLVTEVHAAGIVEQGVEVAPSLTRRFDGLVGQVDGPVRVRRTARLLTPQRGGEDQIRERRGLGQERVRDDDEDVALGQDPADPRGLGKTDGRIRAEDPEQPDGARLGEMEDLHRVRRRRPGRQLRWLDVPDLRGVGDMGRVVPVAERDELAVDAAFARVLCRRLAVHLEDGRTRLPDQAADDVEVVRLHRTRRRLQRLVDALEAGCRLHRRRRDSGHALHFVGSPGVRGCDEALEIDRVVMDERFVDPAVLDDDPQDPVEQWQVRPRSRCEVDIRTARRLREPGIDHDQLRRCRAVQPVEDARPQHRLCRGDVVADEEDRLGRIEVGIRPGRAVGPERFDQRVGRRRGAQAGVAVDVSGADPGLRDHCQRVVLLQEQLAAVVEPVRPWSLVIDEMARPLDELGHGCLPVDGLEPSTAPEERSRQPICAGIRLPAVQALRTQPTVADAIAHSPADPDHLSVCDTDIDAAAGRAKDADRRDPAIDGRDRADVGAGRPLTDIGRSRTPYVRDRIAARSRLGDGSRIRSPNGAGLHRPPSGFILSSCRSILARLAFISSSPSFDSWLPL